MRERERGQRRNQRTGEVRERERERERKVSSSSPKVSPPLQVPESELCVHSGVWGQRERRRPCRQAAQETREEV